MFSAKNRTQDIKELQQTEFDILIIGGGITGAGIALDASSRGLKTALVEMQDFAAGTSSRSTKLVHGGLRYLKQYEFALVAEVGREREIAHRNAPHLTTPEPMMLPIVKNGSMGMLMARIGMTIYEWLAGVRKEEYHKVLNKKETLQAEPNIKPDDLLGSILFYEYRTDDARLTIEVLKTAIDNGAKIINYAQACDFLYEENKIAGAKVIDILEQKTFTIKAKHIVNAGGPWVDNIDDLEPNHGRHKLTLTKGVHLVFDKQKLPIHQAVYFDTFDKRMIFAIPRNNKVYVGTTDTFYKNDFTEPRLEKDEVLYLLKCINDYFPKCLLQLNDVESYWAGVRPLVAKPGKGPSEISRKDELFLSASGLITIAGGKLTGYRKMAQRVVDLIAKRSTNIPKCSTQHLPISGGNLKGFDNYNHLVEQKTILAINKGLTEKEAINIANRYAANTDKLLALIDRTIDQTIPQALEIEILYAIEHEMCQNAVDFFLRRTGAMLFDIQYVKGFTNPVHEYFAQYFGWTKEQNEQNKEALEACIKMHDLSTIR